MADSQVRAALTNLGADVRADFYHTLAAWQNHWLLPASASPSDWLATDHLVAEVGSTQAPFDSLLDLQRFLTAGFLPSVNTPYAESASATAADRTAPMLATPADRTAAVPAAPGRATSPVPAAPGRATSAVPATAGEQAADQPPPPVDRTRGAAAPADVHAPAASPLQWPPAPGPARATPPSASLPSPDPGQPGTPAPDAMHGSGLRARAQPGPSALPLPAQANDPTGAGEPPSWAAPPTRIGGLRDLAQRLPADTHPPTPWADPPAASASRPWPAHRPDRPAPRVEEPLIAASTSPAASSLTRVPSQLATPGAEDSAAALPPVIAPASTTPAASVLHGQSEPIPAPAPAAAIPPVHTTLSQVDTLMDALAREITREYHRFYGA